MIIVIIIIIIIIIINDGQNLRTIIRACVSLLLLQRATFVSSSGSELDLDLDLDFSTLIWNREADLGALDLSFLKQVVALNS